MDNFATELIFFENYHDKNLSFGAADTYRFLTPRTSSRGNSIRTQVLCWKMVTKCRL